MRWRCLGVVRSHRTSNGTHEQACASFKARCDCRDAMPRLPLRLPSLHLSDDAHILRARPAVFPFRTPITGHTSLLITGVNQGGLVQQWNVQNPTKARRPLPKHILFVFAWVSAVCYTLRLAKLWVGRPGASWFCPLLVGVPVAPIRQCSARPSSAGPACKLLGIAANPLAVSRAPHP